MATSDRSFDILKVLTEADKFRDVDQLEKLKLLAMAVIPYSMIDGPSVGVVHIYKKIEARYEGSAPAIITRLLAKAGFRQKHVSQLSGIPACETALLPHLYFTELLVTISDDLGHGEYFGRLKNRIPDVKLGASRDSISTSVELFKRLLFTNTIGLSKEIQSLRLLSEWLGDVGRQDISSKVREYADERERGESLIMPVYVYIRTRITAQIISLWVGHLYSTCAARVIQYSVEWSVITLLSTK